MLLMATIGWLFDSRWLHCDHTETKCWNHFGRNDILPLSFNDLFSCGGGIWTYDLQVTSRIFLPNDWAVEPQSRAIYEHFGLNDRQIELIVHSIAKRDYYHQSQRGNRMFELGLGPVGLALCGSSTPKDQKLINRFLYEKNGKSFVDNWFREKELHWAAYLLEQFNETPPGDREKSNNIPEVLPHSNKERLLWNCADQNQQSRL